MPTLPPAGRICRRESRLEAPGRTPQYHFTPLGWPDPGALSPVDALSSAWEGTARLLFHPFHRRRWVVLSLVCLFLGGGTSTAAFQWGFGALPVDLHPSQIFLRVRMIMAGHVSLIVLGVILSVGSILGLIYLRCMFRFILVDAVIRQKVAVAEGWGRLRPLGRSYFLWLVGVSTLLLSAASGAALVSYLYLNRIREAGYPDWIGSVLLATELAAVVGAGLLFAVIVTLTDDLVAPVMCAEGIKLRAAWRILWKLLRRDAGAFLYYLVLRFAVGMGISIAVLVVLFPLLMGLSTGTLVAAALGVVVLRALGLEWVWNPATISLGALGLGVFTAVLFALLSVVGMPGQVYLQNYGVRFIASRVPSLQNLCNAPEVAERWR